MSGHKGPNSQSEGSRAGQLLKKRQAEKDEMAAKKIQIAKVIQRTCWSLHSPRDSRYDAVALRPPVKPTVSLLEHSTLFSTRWT